MALFTEIDLRSDKSKKYICTISLCRQFGDETIRIHETLPSAEFCTEWLNETGCGGNCRRDHYIVEIPRGHVRNMKNRPHYKACSYLRWLINEGIVTYPKVA